MKNFDENELIDKAMAGRLSADEERLWQALLAERPDLEADVEIGRAMRAMPSPPAVASNFSSVVLQQITKEEAHARVPSRPSWFRWPRLARLTGVAVVALGLGIAVTHHRHEQQQEMAASVKSLAGGLRVVANKPDGQPEAVVNLLQDFDAIRQLPANNDVDFTLLTALRSDE
jgi:hypothetical protein